MASKGTEEINELTHVPRPAAGDAKVMLTCYQQATTEASVVT